MKPTQQYHATQQMRQMRLLSATALLDDGLTHTRTCRQVLDMKARQVVKNMHGNVYGLKLRLALKKTLIGRISKGFGFLGHRGHRSYGFGALGLTGLAQQTIDNDNDNHKQKLLQLDEPSASDQRVGKYLSNWLRWTHSGWTRACNGFAKSQHQIAETLRVYGTAFKMKVTS